MHIMKKLLTLLCAAAFCMPLAAGSKIDGDARRRAEDIVSRMTLEEKCRLIHGEQGKSEYADGFHIMPNDRLGIPAVRMADGPQGVRNNTRSTYYPCGISLAASWNRTVAGGVGGGIGTDARARGVGIMLCPGVNIYRTALCGRNFEYYGEDSFLASETAAAYIGGMQSKGVMSTIKHFALNNQEYDRHRTGSYADERTINEIYFPTFRKAVEKADVACVMTSYNFLNSVHASENAWLIESNLRKWGFEGIVMSDWTSTYTTYGCLVSGLDLEMPHGDVLNYEAVRGFVENGVVDEAQIDRKCVHILQSLIAYGFLDNEVQDTSIPEDCDESRASALAAALEGPVMLKNDGVLPLRKSSKKIIVLGPNADRVPFGGGSGSMTPVEGRNVTLYAGLSRLRGYKVELMDWQNPDYDLLRKAGTVIYAGGFDHDSESEGFDRTYELPEGQNETIARLAEANANLVVVIYSGGEVDVRPWLDKAAGLVMAWYPGQEGGTAMASILSGAVSPSGRLPFTFWGSLEANPAYANYHASDNPSRRKSDRKFAEYKEGIFLGYRGMERFGVKPLFPFGYGLTYSSFAYSDIDVATAEEGLEVKFKVTNTGWRRAAEVAQVYLAPIGSEVLKPSIELKGYEKVALDPGKSVTLTVKVPYSSISHYDTGVHDWVCDHGRYRVQVAASSTDVRLSEEIVIK